MKLFLILISLIQYFGYPTPALAVETFQLGDKKAGVLWLTEAAFFPGRNVRYLRAFL